MCRRLLLIALLCCAAVMPQVTTLRAGEKKDRRFSKSAQKEYDRREKLILKELATLKSDEWAGEYSYGNGLSRNQRLLFAPKSGFVFTAWTHHALIDRNYGEVSRTAESFKLTFKFPDVGYSEDTFGEEMLPVLWGELHYLIPAQGVIFFCNAINSGTEPPEKVVSANGEVRASRLLSGFLLRVGDENKSVNGLPNIPARFLEYILENPIETTIALVGEIKNEKKSDPQFIYRYTRITLAAGRAEGVRQHMEFFIKNPAANDARATVLEVNQHTSEAVVDQLFFSTAGPVPAIGWRLSTCFVNGCGKQRAR